MQFILTLFQFRHGRPYPPLRERIRRVEPASATLIGKVPTGDCWAHEITFDSF
jgi:hypothetical protein